MKFLYVDTRNNELVAIFSGHNDEIFHWNEEQIRSRILYYKTTDDNVVTQCYDALLAMNKPIRKKWWFSYFFSCE